MSKHILIKKLQDIGFSDTEAIVYLASVQVGTKPVSTIAKAADMNRISTYSILKRLFKEGMVSVVEHDGVQHFTALDPALLVQDIEQKATNLAKSLPLLQFLQKGEEGNVNVQFFEGIEGIKKAYLESLNASTDICNYADSQGIRRHWPEYDEQYAAKRAQEKIFLRGLARNDAFGRKVRSHNKKYYRDIRLISKKYFTIENEVKIFNDKMLIISFQPSPFAVIIESQAVADTQRQIFEIAWGAAKKKN